jgi:hypothetical protein
MLTGEEFNSYSRILEKLSLLLQLFTAAKALPVYIDALWLRSVQDYINPTRRVSRGTRT